MVLGVLWQFGNATLSSMVTQTIHVQNSITLTIPYMDGRSRYALQATPDAKTPRVLRGTRFRFES